MSSGSVPKDKWEWYKIKPYLVYVGMFVATIYTNMRALQHSNVETVIVFRSACPLIVSVLDWAFLGRQLIAEGVQPAAVERAIELSEKRYCPAQAMLAPTVPMTLTYEIIETGAGDG